MHELFLIDPDVIFLNHGSFGACPIPVFEVYQQWQRDLERQPVEFLGRRVDDLLDDARAKLATYIGADHQDLIFVPNATTGINLVARSLHLQPGDEILATDHEYGAVDRTWQFVCQKTGAEYVRHPLPFPYDPETFVDHLWEAVNPRTRVIAISHITSPTAFIFPVEAICRRARAEGILTVIDGAHVPGQLPLDLEALGADFYTGNCHKWLCAAKGSAFLHVRKEHQDMIEPLVISWGYAPETSFVTRNQWQGTRDVAAFLSVPAAIDFQHSHNWDAVRQQCHTLAVATRNRLIDLTGMPALAPESAFMQMFTFALPPCDAPAIKKQLYDEFRIELPEIVWQRKPYMRVSIQGYNTEEECTALINALHGLLR